MKKTTKQVFSSIAAALLIGTYICVLVAIMLDVAHADLRNGLYKAKYGPDKDEPAIIQICEENRVAAFVEPSRAYFDVPLDKNLQDHIMDICDEREIDYRIAFAMIKCESGFRPDAVGDGGNSLGLMQIQQRWHYARMERLGCDNLLDPYQNVMVGLDLFGDLLKHYSVVEHALMAYNGGGSYANNMIAEGRISGYVTRILACADELTYISE